MMKLRWVALGLAVLMSLAACDWLGGQWGGGPSAGQGSPYQPSRYGD
jgi:hypothetical protein